MCGGERPAGPPPNLRRQTTDKGQCAQTCGKAVRHRGGRVPDDVAVVGFDDIQMASIFEPGVTTIAQPMFDIGKQAMKLLLQLIDGEEVERRQFVLPDRLVIRESCGGKRRM